MTPSTSKSIQSKKFTGNSIKNQNLDVSLARKSMLCYKCSKKASIKLENLDDVKEPICLLHYNCCKYSLEKEKYPPIILNQPELHKQFQYEVKDLWIRAVSEVVDMIFEAEKVEKKISKDDKNTIESMNREAIMMNLIGSELIKSKKTNRIDNSSSSSSVILNKPLWNPSLDTNNEITTISEGLLNYNDICIYCNSNETVRRYKNLVSDIQKIDTWGSSSAPAIIYEIICNVCNLSKKIQE